MSPQSFAAVLQHFQRLSRFGRAGADGDDADLLDRFVRRQDREAFAQLVERHGPLVLRVCRRILGHEHDVEDAFQATFLILARKARAIRRQRSIASWLYAVAQRVAWNARAGIARRHLLEQRVPDMQWVENELSAAQGQAESDPARLAQRRELEALIERELGRLPEKFRAPLILCDLQGRSHGEAALELGVPQGSISRLLERGRELLRERLVRRGLTLGTAALAALLTPPGRAAVPAAWVQTAAEAAVRSAAGAAIPAGLLSAQAITLCQGVLRAMRMKNLQLILVSLLTFGLLAGGGVLAVSAWAADPAVQAAQAPEKKAPAAEPARKAPDQAPVLKERFSVTEKAKEKQGMVYYLSVKEGGMFFSGDGNSLYFQRGGGFGGGFGFGGGGGLGGAGALGGGGFGGGGMGFANLPKEHLSVWNLATKKKGKDIPGSQAAVLSPSGNAIAMIGVFNNKRLLRLMNTKTGKVTASTPLTAGGPGVGGFNVVGLHPAFSGSLGFTPDGKRVVVRDGFDTDIRFWNPQTNRLTRSKMVGLQYIVGLLPDGKSAVGLPQGMGFNGGFGALGGAPGAGAGAAGGNISVWDVTTGKLVRSFGDIPFSRGVLAPTGTNLATFNRGMGVMGMGMMGMGGGGLGGFGGGKNPGFGMLGGQGVKGPPAEIRLWDAATGKALATCETKIAPEMVRQQFGQNGFVGMPGGINDVAFAPDGRTVASCMGSGEGGYVHLFDARSGREILHLPLKFCPQAIAFSRDGTLLATGGGLGALEVRVWDVAGLTGPRTEVALNAASLPGLWDDLAAEDLAKSLGAERTLGSAAPKLVLPLLREKLKPVPSTDEDTRRIAQRIADLDSAQFKVREKATKELADGGLAAAVALKQALKTIRTDEFRRRAEALLGKLEQQAVLTAEQRRQQRAVAVLEILGSVEARRLLDELASGAPEAWLTQEARAAQQRLQEGKNLLPAR